jgi:hypothetical protein
MKNDWIENIEECITGEEVLLKASFDIYTSFSCLQPIIEQMVKQKKIVAKGDIKIEKYEFDIKDVCIDKRLHVQKLFLHENKHEAGYFEVELVYRVKINKASFKDNYSDILRETSELLLEYFKHTLSYIGYSIIIIPNSLWVYINFKDDWKKVVQMGKMGIPNIGCSRDSINELIKNLPEVITNLEKSIKVKKFEKIMISLNTALRLEHNQLYRDAFLNFYNIIETIFRDKKFKAFLSKTLNKTNEESEELSKCNQKELMCALWEFINIINQKNFSKYKIIDFTDLAKKRNKYTHNSDFEITQDQMSLVRFITFYLVHHYSKLLVVNDIEAEKGLKA